VEYFTGKYFFAKRVEYLITLIRCGYPLHDFKQLKGDYEDN